MTVEKNDVILGAYADRVDGRTAVWVVLRNRSTGEYRVESILPDEMTDFMRRICCIAVHTTAMLVGEAKEIARKGGDV